MSKLALFGGTKISETPFPLQNSIGDEERHAALRVLDSGVLSGYRGEQGNLRGGPEVIALEEEFADKFRVKNAIAINSATSGLLIALVSVHPFRGGHAFVVPMSMCCSATVPIFSGMRISFIDVEPDHYCMKMGLALSNIKEHLPRVMIIVDLFGQPFDAKALDKHLLQRGDRPWIIEDAAQAIGAKYKDQYCGTLGDIGVFSFNQGKHISCGEGGMIVTDHSDIAKRCRELMNHSEQSADPKSRMAMISGFNMRMTEIQAAIMREQLKKLNNQIERRRDNAYLLINQLTANIPAISFGGVREDCSHTFYVLPLKWDKGWADGIHRNLFLEAVRAELIPYEEGRKDLPVIYDGYVPPIYELPIFGEEPKGFNEGGNIVVENLHRNELFLLRTLAPPNTLDDQQDIIRAFEKVWENRKDLQNAKR